MKKAKIIFYIVFTISLLYMGVTTYCLNYNKPVGAILVNVPNTFVANFSTKAALDREATKIVDEIISSDMDDHERVKRIYDYVVTHVKYSDNYESGYSAFRGESNCSGIAYFMEILLDKAGIESKKVSGVLSNNRGNHAWNLIKIDGNWYHTDATTGIYYYSKNNNLYDTYKDFYNVSDDIISIHATWIKGLYPEAQISYKDYLEKKAVADHDKRAAEVLSSLGY